MIATPHPSAPCEPSAPPETVAIPYTIRRSTRAKKVRVTVDAHAGVEVVLPSRAPRAAAAAAVGELRPWIERRMAAAEETLAKIAARAGTVPYLDSVLELVQQSGRTRVHRSGECLLIPEGDARPALERYYRRAARAEITARVESASARCGSSYRSVSIRAQRTRWGSCSADGALSFNWRLLLAPECVLDYVIWHEVCHLDVLDHSPRFWALLSARRPSWRQERDWLRRHGATLVL